MEMESTQEQKTIDSDRFETDPLNANPDPKHFSYKVLGMLSWATLVFCFVGFVVAPRLFLNVARVVAMYMMVRLIVFAIFYLAGLVKIRIAEKQASGSPYPGLSSDEISRHKAIHHLVVLPNFNEPEEILIRTLQSLTVQADARHNLTVVLGMEEREPGARDKAEAVLAMYKGSFYRLMATFHPSNLPGEAPGKGTNETWAVRCAREELVHRLGIPLNQIVVTAIDSDSILHPHYFAELTRQFAADPRRYSLVWQAPILLDNDIWYTSGVIRLLTFFSNAISTGDYVNPWEARFPYSTYSISLKLLEEVNFWDPTVIAEDVNIFMRAFFTKGGRTFIRRIYLPIHGNPVYGVNLRHAAGIFFNQKVRQGWGGTEIGYIIQKWDYPPGAPFFTKLGRLLKLIHDHLFFSTAGFIVALGTLLSIMIDHTAVITLPPASFNPLLFITLNLLGGAALVVIWFTERGRLARGRMDWSLKSFLGETLAWVIFPVLFLLLMNLPGLLAQTQMMLGKPISFNRTPKGLKSRLGD
jgi:cellulose synthase/poly-beta-1,6-N-acetylglucosamine synthase-like glycosyltransferase